MTAVVQNVSSTPLGNAITRTLTMAATATGNTIVVECALRSNNNPFKSVTVTDNKSNVYTQRKLATGEAGQRAAVILDCINATAGVTSIVVAPNYTGGVSGMTGCISIQEVSGITGIDQIGIGTYSSSPLIASCTNVDTGTTDFVAACCSVGNNSAAAGISSPPAGYTSAVVQQNDTGASASGECCYRINTSAVTDTVSWAVSAGGTATDPAVIVSYASGITPPPPPPPSPTPTMFTSGGMVIGSGGFDFGSGLSQPLQVNFQPGVYMLSVNTNGWSTSVTGANSVTGNGRNASEITAIVASMVAHPTVFAGYSPQYFWSALDGINPTTPGVVTAGANNDFQTFVAACATAGVVGFFVPQVAAYVPWKSGFSGGAGGAGAIPNYVINGGTATYGTPSQGGSGAGWALGNYGYDSGNPTFYQFVHARFDVAGTSNAYITFWQNFANAPLTALAGPYAGIPYTWGTHPQVSGMVDWTDADVNMINGNPTVPATWNAGTFQVNRANQAATIQPLIPNVPFALMGGYGPNGNGSGSAVGQNLTIIQSLNGANAGLSCSDVLYRVSGGPNHPTYTQQFFIGNQNTGTNSSPIWSPGGTLYAGNTLSMPDVQGFDYTYNGAASAANVNGILAFAYNVLVAQYVFMASNDGTNSWGGNNVYGATGIQGVIAAYGPCPNQTYPY